MSEEKPMGQVIQIDEARIRDHLGEMVRGTVEETLNALLDAEADRLCGAGRYERSQARQDTRSASSDVADQRWQHRSEELACRIFRSLDQAIGSQQQRLRYRELQCLRGLHIDRKLERRGLLDRNIGGFRAAKNSVDERRGATVMRDGAG